MPKHNFVEWLRAKQDAARQAYLERVDEVKPAPDPVVGRLMTSEEIRAELRRLEAEEREEAEAPIRRAEELARRREEEKNRIAEARKRVAQRWVHDPKTMASELRKFDRRQRKKGIR
jgi:hypothetical protein